MLAVDDALALRAELEARGFEAPFILIRHSIGGLYMQAFARMYPRLMAELVSVDGGGREWALHPAGPPAGCGRYGTGLRDGGRAGRDRVPGQRDTDASAGSACWLAVTCPLSHLAQRIHDADLYDRRSDGRVYPWRICA
jgi:pimeloyl-ACP methyl ester carboxylesterase